MRRLADRLGSSLGTVPGAASRATKPNWGRTRNLRSGYLVKIGIRTICRLVLRNEARSSRRRPATWEKDGEKKFLSAIIHYLT